MSALSRPTRLMLVDDDPVVLRLLTKTLERRGGLSIVTASSGQEALDRLAREICDVVVSDVIMPGMSGYALLTEIRQRFPSVVRVLLSGAACEPEALGLVHQYWTKPWDADVLVAGLTRTARITQLVANRAWRAHVGDVEALPAAPAIVLRLNRVLADPGAGAEDVAEVIESDPAMAAKVLQLASSAFFGVAGPTSSIEKAVVRMGVEVVRSLATASALFAAITPPREILDVGALQSSSLQVAQVASQLVDSLQDRQAAFAAGLLRGVGQLVLAARVPELYRELTLRSARADRPVADYELESLGVTNGELAAYLLGIWGLPEVIVEAVARQHDVVLRPEGALRVGHAVRIASLLVQSSRDEDFVVQAADLGWLGHLATAERAAEWRSLVLHLVSREGPPRRHPRAAVSWPARLQMGETTLEGTACDVSLRGVFVATGQALAVGTDLYVVLLLPNGEALAVAGVVRWSGRSVAHGTAGVGIELDQEQPALRAYFRGIGRQLGRGPLPEPDPA